ncbi:hypothetical protein TNCT_704821 [Trichonephila clavata]|uniref:Uncharacterized protein n=1 Tax=Trichonephila clavata TaxID=2740835 RepID=A0A8X6KT71_TRICU|nr:hypothetical protein TNCT_704821 [Trichonephila clavata]
MQIHEMHGSRVLPIIWKVQPASNVDVLIIRRSNARLISKARAKECSKDIRLDNIYKSNSTERVPSGFGKAFHVG